MSSLVTVGSVSILDLLLVNTLNLDNYLTHIHHNLQLKVYASTQRRRSSWTAADFKYKGYSCNSWTPGNSLVVSIAVVTVALTTLVLIAAAPKVYQRVTSLGYSFFWAASFVASVCNIALVVCFGIVSLCKMQIIKIQIIKIATIFLLLVVDFFAAICIPKNTEFPVPRLAYLFSFLLCCLCCCFICCVRSRHSKQLHSHLIQTLALTNLIIFAQFIALSAIPTIMWAFVFPIQTLAAIAFFNCCSYF